MEGAVLVWLLCLQGSLLVNTLNCADKGTWGQTEEYRRECVGGDATRALPAELTERKSPAPPGALWEPGLAQLAKRVRRQTDPKKRRRPPGTFSVLGITFGSEPTEKPPPSRSKRQLERERDRPKKLHYPGSTSVTGQPMRLMLTERSPRQLPAMKTKPRRKPRVGSFSLLSHKQPKSLQVTRVRRQLQNDKMKKKKKKNKRPGQYSPLGDSRPPLEVTRVRRQLQNDKMKKKKKKDKWPGQYSPLGDSLPPLEVTRVRRQLQNDKTKRKKNKRPGQYSALGGSLPTLEVTRVRRQLQNDKTKKKKNKRPGLHSALGRIRPTLETESQEKLTTKEEKLEENCLFLNAP
ncbi:uncharacterized protein si:dkey-12l12.1 isoform X1 [Anguilla anguilla]|uniref:uncharacterized protein si:dkey-12l12.1 isoform X1 n=1 Tax=Anguilla anguilla TaxID=7936 RepID=UPI0015B06EC6|nr:uncharacterized protein si:dkey-12l12.1 isoform X1 [Anguilla anguilla]